MKETRIPVESSKLIVTMGRLQITGLKITLRSPAYRKMIMKSPAFRNMIKKNPALRKRNCAMNRPVLDTRYQQ